MYFSRRTPNVRRFNSQSSVLNVQLMYRISQNTLALGFTLAETPRHGHATSLLGQLIIKLFLAAATPQRQI